MNAFMHITVLIAHISLIYWNRLEPWAFFLLHGCGVSWHHIRSILIYIPLVLYGYQTHMIQEDKQDGRKLKMEGILEGKWRVKNGNLEGDLKVEGSYVCVWVWALHAPNQEAKEWPKLVQNYHWLKGIGFESIYTSSFPVLSSYIHSWGIRSKPA